MDKKNILPNQGKPVIRTTTGQLPSHLAELSEEALGDAGVDASICPCMCSYDGVGASICPCMCSYDGVGASICPCMCSYDGDE
ncbi:MAG: microcyclamide/patellamide family RiPP [Brasilonema angustatum HA4187-MV1]|nr:microcyclamide/patellamide family RiPP [Brasilonema angustatum HA4187-MV1]